jgi:hypothetical protein
MVHGANTAWDLQSGLGRAGPEGRPERLYFVVETKGSLFADALRSIDTSVIVENADQKASAA